MKYVSKKDCAYEQIKNDILSGELKPGQRLIIRDLSSKYEMSNIPIREAISQLYYEGLVHNVPCVGATVAEVNINKIFETTALRFSLENYIFKICFDYFDDKIVDRLNELLNNLYEYYEMNDIKSYMITNRSFYVTMYDYLPSNDMKKQLDELYDMSRINTSIISPDQIPLSLEKHKDLISLIKSKDKEKACECHKEQKVLSILAVFDKMDELLKKPELIFTSEVASLYRGKDIVMEKEYLQNQIKFLRKIFLEI